MMFPSSLVKPFDIPIFDPHHIAPGGSCGASAGARLATLGRQPRFAEWFTNSLGAGAVVPSDGVVSPIQRWFSYENLGKNMGK